MGPEGEDALFTFLKGKLKGWQTALLGYKPLAETGDYPGLEEIKSGLTLTKKLLADEDSFKFIEHFNAQKDDLQGSERRLPRPRTLLRAPEADLGCTPQGVRAVPAEPQRVGA